MEFRSNGFRYRDHQADKLAIAHFLPATNFTGNEFAIAGSFFRSASTGVNPTLRRRCCSESGGRGLLEAVDGFKRNSLLLQNLFYLAAFGAGGFFIQVIFLSSFVVSCFSLHAPHLVTKVQRTAMHNQVTPAAAPAGVPQYLCYTGYALDTDVACGVIPPSKVATGLPP